MIISGNKKGEELFSGSIYNNYGIELIDKSLKTYIVGKQGPEACLEI